jgi:hypothetical protein
MEGEAFMLRAAYVQTQKYVQEQLGEVSDEAGCDWVGNRPFINHVWSVQEFARLPSFSALQGNF